MKFRMARGRRLVMKDLVAVLISSRSQVARFQQLDGRIDGISWSF